MAVNEWPGLVSDYFYSTVDKVENFFEGLSVVLTDRISSAYPMLTVSVNDNLYNQSIIANWFHSIPHVDIKLRPLPANITFDPNDNEYLESIGILVAIPGFWLILTLIFFLIFFLCRCCDGSGNGLDQQKKKFHQQATLVSKANKPRRLTGCKFCLTLVTCLATIAITISLFGSILFHRGMVQLYNSTANIADVFGTVQNDTRTAAYYLHDEIDTNIESLKSSIEKMLVKDVSVKANLETQLFFLKRNVSRCIRRVDDIYSRIERLNIRPIPDTVSLVEKIRWPATFIFGFLLVLFCLILLFGIIRHSRCTLIMFSVCGLLALVLGWVLSSLYLGLLVAGSDFCAEPDSFLDDRFSNEAEMAILDYYIRCRYQTHHFGNSPQTISHPFRVQTRASLIAIDHMSELIRALEMLCISYCSPDQNIVRPQINSIVQHLNSTERLLKSVQALLDCRRIHEDYITSMSATCKNLIEGLFVLLVASAAIGLLFTLLVLCASHTWIHIRSINPNSSNSLINNGSGASSSLLGQLDNVDETDPFLPSTPRNPISQQHHTILSNHSTSSSITNQSIQGKRFRDSYGSSAYGTTGRGRFSHTPPQTPHFTTLGNVVGLNQQQSQHLTLAQGRRSDEQLAFLSPPPAYDQLSQQQQQQLQQYQQQQQQNLYGIHHTGTLPHPHHHHPGSMMHHQSAIGHYMADPTDIMIRAPTQYSSFGHPS